MLNNGSDPESNYCKLDVDLQIPLHTPPPQRNTVQNLASNTSSSLDILHTVQQLSISDCVDVVASQVAAAVDILNSILNSNSTEYPHEVENLSSIIPDLVPCATKSLYYMKDKVLRGNLIKDPTNIYGKIAFLHENCGKIFRTRYLSSI
jgi:hypothetical protein